MLDAKHVSYEETIFTKDPKRIYFLDINIWLEDVGQL
jgi:hypothetical protein